MSEAEEKLGILGRAKNFFFEQAPPKEAPEEQGAPQASAPADAPESPVDAAGAAGASDFASAYAQIACDGDSMTDQVMGAYVDMASQGLEGQPLATAMTSMIRAFGADAKAIAHNVTLRTQAIAAAVGSRREWMQGRIAELEARTAAIVAAAEEEIKELQARISTLTEQVARAKAAVQETDAGERDGFSAFERQAAQKSGELKAFADFLAATAPKT